MAIGDYVKTTYVNDSPPSLSASNLNNSEDKVSELDAWAETPATDTISERTSAAGVTIDGLLIKDGDIGQGGGVGLCPVGSMTMYAGASVPTGWLLCDGQAVSRTTYSALFTAISTTWGVGNGSTTFNVPDMREASPYGVGTFSAVGGTTHGSITEHDALALGEFGDDRSQSHLHELEGTPNATIFQGGYVQPGANKSGTLLASDAVSSPVTDGANGTPRGGATTRGKIIGVNFIIKY